MEELIITKEMRDKINNYLGYELIKKNEVGHHIYDEAPGLGRIGIEGNELRDVVTNKQLDSNGNVEWYKTPNPKAKPGIVKPFHCKLTTVSSKKAKILIASLFPEEKMGERFQMENRQMIQNLRDQLNVLKMRKKMKADRQWLQNKKANSFLMGPNDMFMESAQLYVAKEEEKPKMMLGPNDMLI